MAILLLKQFIIEHSSICTFTVKKQPLVTKENYEFFLAHQSYFSTGIVISRLQVELAQVPPRNTSYHISSMLLVGLDCDSSCEDQNTTQNNYDSNIISSTLQLTHCLLEN